MNFERIKTENIEQFMTEHNLAVKPYLMLIPQTSPNIDYSDIIFAWTEPDYEYFLLDNLFLNGDWWSDHTGFLSTAITALDCYGIFCDPILNNIVIDSNQNYIFNEINITEYYSIIKSKLNVYNLENLINMLPDSEKLQCRIQTKSTL